MIKTSSQHGAGDPPLRLCAIPLTSAVDRLAISQAEKVGTTALKSSGTTGFLAPATRPTSPAVVVLPNPRGFPMNGPVKCCWTLVLVDSVRFRKLRCARVYHRETHLHHRKNGSANVAQSVERKFSARAFGESLACSRRRASFVGITQASLASFVGVQASLGSGLVFRFRRCTILLVRSTFRFD